MRADGHLDLAAAAAADRELLEVSAHTLRQVAAVMSGQAASADLEPVWRARLASARHLHTLADDPAIAVRRADDAFHAQAIGVATSAALGEALIAARLASPAAVATQRRNWIADLPESEQSALVDSPDGSHGPWAAMPSSILGTVSSDASLRSVWFRNSARGAVALAAAVAVAKLTDVQHAFWVVLGTLSVLRTSAAATGSTALRALGRHHRGLRCRRGPARRHRHQPDRAVDRVPARRAGRRLHAGDRAVRGRAGSLHGDHRRAVQPAGPGRLAGRVCSGSRTSPSAAPSASSSASCSGRAASSAVVGRQPGGRLP